MALNKLQKRHPEWFFFVIVVWPPLEICFEDSCFLLLCALSVNDSKQSGIDLRGYEHV